MTKARDIADGVDTADIADGAISTAKLADGSISTAKIADTAITDAKISGMSSSKLTGALPAISGASLTGISAGLPGPRAEVFTSSGTFTVPSGVTACKVTVVGGGGGGGGAYQADRAGCGGGGGGTAIEWITGLTAGDTVSVTIGAGGTGGGTTAGSQDGNSGGTSSFGSYCSATGGEGGVGNIYGTSAVKIDGGLGTGGTFNYRGGAGGSYVSDPSGGQGGAGGGGGSPTQMGITPIDIEKDSYTFSYYKYEEQYIQGPYGGRPGTCTYGQNASTTKDATGYGCGGGGEGYDGYNTLSDFVGGDGYQGIVIVEY